MRWGIAVVSMLVGMLLLPAGASAGRAITGPCRTVFCGGISQDGARVVFPFEEELTAGAGNRQIYERSGGETHPLVPPGAQYWPRLDEVSSDAAHVFVTTNLALSPEDADGFGIDVFDISAGRATLISTGPLNGSDSGFPFFAGSSPNGQRAFFEAFGPVTAQDTDSCYDLYERAAGQTALVGPNPAPPPAYPVCEGTRFGGVSADGSHLFFTSEAELEPGDERGDDIYQQVGGTLTRLTTYPEPESTCVDLVKFAGASSDGRTVLFATNVQVVAEDTDSAGDVYKRRPDGTFSLVSRGTNGGNGQCGFDGDRPVALSADGATTIFETTTQLSPADRDASNDLYSTDDGGAIELISTGPTDANVDERSIVFPDWLALASEDAKRVAFETHQPLVAADKDTAADVYLRAGGQTELVSTGAPRKTQANAELLDISGDGQAILFATKEALVAKDTDHETDVYVRWVQLKRTILVSGETMAPQMRVSSRGRALRSGRIAIRLLCPKEETSGPCHGKLKLKTSRRGKLIGSKSYEIPAGRRKLLIVRPRRALSPSRRSVFAIARGLDRLGNGATATRRVTLVGH